MMLVHWGNTNSKYNYSTTQYPPDKWDLVPKRWRGKHACYDPKKDLVMPSWKHPDPNLLQRQLWTRYIIGAKYAICLFYAWIQKREDGAEVFLYVCPMSNVPVGICRGIERRPVLFYFRGNLGSKYAQGRPEPRSVLGTFQMCGTVLHSKDAFAQHTPCY